MKISHAQLDKQTKKETQKHSYFHSRFAMHKLISSKLGMLMSVPFFP